PVARHTVPAWPAGCVQRGLPTLPLHVSVVQGLPSSVQADPAALTALAGQVVLDPVQVSARSHSLTVARHTVPAWPAGCVQRGLLVLPLQVSVVQTLPSSVQAVPADLTVVGQVVLAPVQVWSRSHSLSAVWHGVPAVPARCGQRGLLVLPLHVAVVQALRSSVQAVAAVANVHVAVQQEPDWPFWAPRSHCSPASTWPSPHAALKVAMEAAQGRDGLSVPPAE